MNFTLKKSDLNFKVYTVPSEPTTAGAKNDIAIISSVPMTNWLMSPEKPSGIPRADGDVWIQYSTSGNTKNILKQNTLMIATISAWQYVGGAWVDKTAKSYTGDKWVDWVTREYIFKDGEFYFGEMSTSTPGRLYVDGGELVFVTVQEKGTWGYLTEQVDLTHYKKLKAKMKQTTVLNNMCIVLSVTTTSPPTAGDSDKVKSRSKAYLEITATDGEIHELETSVETLGGLHYIEFASIASGAIVEAWFE